MSKSQDKSLNGRQNDDLDDDDEHFMTLTSQDKAAWEKMIKSRIELLKNNQDEFQKWKDNMTRRRMFVYSRMRKLYATQMDRFRFLLKMSETVKHIKDSNNSDDNSKSNDNNNNNNNNDNDNNDSNNNNNNSLGSNPDDNPTSTGARRNDKDPLLPDLNPNPTESREVTVNSQDTTGPTTRNDSLPIIMEEVAENTS